MGELRGTHRVHFIAALVLGGADLLCMASTWLPDAVVAPKWLVMSLFVAVFPVLGAALFRGIGMSRLLGRGNGHRLVRYILLLPPVVKIGYALVIVAVGAGILTAGSAEDVQKDSSGYYYRYLNRAVTPQVSVRVDLTEPEYRTALKAQLRIFSAGPVVFYAAGSFVVLLSASAAAAAEAASARAGRGAASAPGRGRKARA